MKTFNERIEELRKELVLSIIRILKEKNINEIDISGEAGNSIFVIWFDDDGYPYECEVKKIVAYSGFEQTEDHIHVIARYNGFRNDVEMDSRFELGAMNLDRLCEIYENIAIKLEERNSASNRLNN